MEKKSKTIPPKKKKKRNRGKQWEGMGKTIDLFKKTRDT